MELAEWLTLATLVATLITLYLVAVVELRHRRRYNRVDMHIDYIGSVDGGNGATAEMFEVTNCGTESATRIELIPIGCMPASTTELRPIRTLSPGESKRFIAVPQKDLNECWVAFAYFTSSDRRYKHHSWEPLNPAGPLSDVFLDDMERLDREARVTDRLLRRHRKVQPVGPGMALFTQVRCWKGDNTARDLKIATQPITDWFDEWRKISATPSA